MARRKRTARKPDGTRIRTLSGWLESIKKLHQQSSSSEKGACRVPDPKTGQSSCIRTSPAACEAMGGTFLGGPCA
jgi:hypothetical protein